jgi:hypothetical protein
MARVTVGTRVRLVCCNDPYTRLVPGTLGTVTYVDTATGTPHFKWDDGSTLGLVAEAGDRYEVLMADPRNNADDAYAAFMSMSTEEWKAAFRSVTFEHGAFQEQEQVGFERALRERGLT